MIKENGPSELECVGCHSTWEHGKYVIKHMINNITRMVSSMSNSNFYFEAQSWSVKNGGIGLIAKNWGSGIKIEEWRV